MRFFVAQSFAVLSTFLILDDTKALSLENRNANTRRDVFIHTAAAATGLVVPSLLLEQPQQLAFAGEDASQPIAILGASGRTGALCVTACLSRGVPVRALTRSGSWEPPLLVGDNNNEDVINNKLLSVTACDVKDPKALTQGLQGCRGVIYAASASKKGGNAKEIDNEGVVQAGSVCLAEKIPRYVVISSTATTRPNSLGFKFTNVFGGIMDQKRLGEQGVQAAYNNNNKSSSSYTILRPGGLEEPKKNEVLGPSALEISQGDALAGIVSRADLAEVAVELALSTAPNLQNTAVELYYTDSAQPCERQFKSEMSNGKVPRLHGSTYEELFRDIQPDIDYYVPV